MKIEVEDLITYLEGVRDGRTALNKGCKSQKERSNNAAVTAGIQHVIFHLQNMVVVAKGETPHDPSK